MSAAILYFLIGVLLAAAWWTGKDDPNHDDYLGL